MAGSEASSNPKKSSEPDYSSEPEASLECVANPEGVPDSMRSSSDCEAVTMMGATFMGVALVVRGAHAGVTVPWGMHSGSCLPLETMTSRPDRATNFEIPHAYTRSSFGAISVST